MGLASASKPVSIAATSATGEATGEAALASGVATLPNTIRVPSRRSDAHSPSTSTDLIDIARAEDGTGVDCEHGRRNAQDLPRPRVHHRHVGCARNTRPRTWSVSSVVEPTVAVQSGPSASSTIPTTVPWRNVRSTDREMTKATPALRAARTRKSAASDHRTAASHRRRRRNGRTERTGSALANASRSRLGLVEHPARSCPSVLNGVLLFA